MPTLTSQQDTAAASPHPACSNPKCGKPMRPHNSFADMHPGTVKRGSRGKCASCSYPYRPGKTKRREPSVAPATIEERAADAARSLEAWLAERNYRLAIAARLEAERHARREAARHARQNDAPRVP